ncbi:MAG TPA: endonuclease domain-containing protein [Clostridia bacterium]|nr:endonuclease domain-containing protein [Clostridia bacterium]
MKAYNKNNVFLAKALRKNATPWERKLWYDFLRNHPVRFQRQKPLGNFIADFYCAKARLVVELDGSGHYDSEQTKKDMERIKALEAMRIKVLRICNIDVDRNFYGVCEMIDLVVKTSLPQAAPPPAPSSEGAKERDLP